ncbi:hypothetical protein EVA_19466, partial [gut metagenome]
MMDERSATLAEQTVAETDSQSADRCTADKKSPEGLGAFAHHERPRGLKGGSDAVTGERIGHAC